MAISGADVDDDIAMCDKALEEIAAERDPRERPGPLFTDAEAMSVDYLFRSHSAAAIELRSWRFLLGLRGARIRRKLLGTGCLLTSHRAVRASCCAVLMSVVIGLDSISPVIAYVPPNTASSTRAPLQARGSGTCKYSGEPDPNLSKEKTESGDESPAKPSPLASAYHLDSSRCQ